jgi:glycosyltransferase involved in cell wall biosynthesis
VPSTQESFGGVYTEAWTFSKPVIGCRIPAVSEVINDGENGLLVEQNASDIAAKILQLLEDEAAALKMGNSGREKVTKEYSWEKIAEKTEDVYRTVVEALR